MFRCTLTLFLLLLSPQLQAATPSQVYHVAIHMAAQNKSAEAIAALQAAAALLPEQDLWKARMMAAATLLQLRQQQSTTLPDSHNPNLMLAQSFARQQPKPEATKPWLAATLATLMPGAGHLFLGRTHDALMAFLMVAPMLGLSLWAWRRSMGPITVFFAGLTAWLWSGTIFSALSLSHRGNMEAYLQWWQPLWQAAALSGQPW